MTSYEILKEKLKNRQPVTMANCMNLASPLLIDAFTDADCVLLDKEHGIYGSEELIPLTMRCREKKFPAIVRVEDSQYHLIAKAIDLGADGIMLPRTETLAQVKTAVEAMHFAPLGRTGYGGWGLLRDGETLDDFQKSRFFFPQIESEKGLNAMPEIIETYGDFIDGFIIGPNDYSISLGIPFEHGHPAMIEQIQNVFDVCRRYHKSCGCYAPDTARAQRYAEMGANIFWIGDDLTYLRRGLRSMLDGIPGCQKN